MIEEERFQELVADAWKQMPARWATQVENVALLVEDDPSAEVREQENLGPHDTLLGLYQGISNARRGANYGIGGTLPDTITLYRLPILDVAQQHMREMEESDHNATNFEALVRTVIKETLWHEIGHYFGLSEGEIDEREDEGTNEFR